jgi:Transcriptional regulatory protein, C terminal
MGKGPSLMRSLEEVAATLSAPPPADRAAAAVCEAAAAALGTPVLVATSGELPELRSVTAVPIPLAGRQVGVLLAGRGRLAEDEQAYLKVLAALLGLALGRLPTPPGSHLLVGDIDIDLAEQRVAVGGRAARLTPSEIRLLAFLAEHPGRARTRREILGHLWHSEYLGDLRACDVHIANLRRKIERDPSHPERVVTVRSVGYALRPVARM